MEDSINNSKTEGERETLLQATNHNGSQHSSAPQVSLESEEKNKFYDTIDYEANRNNCNSEGNNLKNEENTEVTDSRNKFILDVDKIVEDYNPFHHRHVKNPTNNIEALIHMLKGSLGSGFLVMPLAFQNGGLWFSLFGIIFVGLIVTYCTHVFVKCGQILCKRNKIPSVNFKQIGELSFLEGPDCMRKYSKFGGLIVDISLLAESLGCCCSYVILVSRNMQQVIEYYSGEQWDLRLYMAALLPPLICLNFIKDLKRLAPISMIANVLFISGIIVSFYYLFTDLPSTSERPAFTTWKNLPNFFGKTIFALEGIGAVIPIENNMKYPQHFLGCPGILNIGMFTVISLYALIGFFGYLKYGEDTKANFTINLPTDRLLLLLGYCGGNTFPNALKHWHENEANEKRLKAVETDFSDEYAEFHGWFSYTMKLGQTLKIVIAVGVFLTYCLLFFIVMSILEGRETKKNNSKSAFYTKRIAIVTATVTVAALFPNLGPFLTLIGALCLGLVGLILPAVFEVLIYSKSPGFGPFYWRLWKNVAIFLFGIVGLVSGTMVGIQEMIDTFDIVKD